MTLDHVVTIVLITRLLPAKFNSIPMVSSILQKGKIPKHSPLRRIM